MATAGPHRLAASGAHRLAAERRRADRAEPAGHLPATGILVGPAGRSAHPAAAGGTGRPKARTPLILTVVAVVVALLAGASVWWFAIRDTATAAAGQPTPQLAVSEMLNSLSDRDMLGVAEQLDPTEAALLKDMSTDVLTELKRLGIIEDSVDLEQFDGVTVTTANLTFDESGEEQVNDHVTVVKLTGGQHHVRRRRRAGAVHRQGQGPGS